MGTKICSTYTDTNVLNKSDKTSRKESPLSLVSEQNTVKKMI